MKKKKIFVRFFAVLPFFLFLSCVSVPSPEGVPCLDDADCWMGYRCRSIKEVLSSSISCALREPRDKCQEDDDCSDGEVCCRGRCCPGEKCAKKVCVR